jgi:ribosomal protein S18 acetylase RimI-like enzyme
MTGTDKTGIASLNVQSASADQQEQVLSTLVLAFSNDPVARWAWPDPQQYLSAFGKFALAFGGKAMAHGSAYLIDDASGAALWLPPGVAPDENRLLEVIRQTVRPREQADVLSLMEQMDAHHPREPHWHLPMIGVDPSRQGQGRGSALLRHALERCDRESALAYLESSSPANIPLYERFGFELIGTIQSGSSPQLWPMVRVPR